MFQASNDSNVFSCFEPGPSLTCIVQILSGDLSTADDDVKRGLEEETAQAALSHCVLDVESIYNQ